MLLFLPMGHEQRIQRFPYITVGIIVLCTIVWIASIPIMLDEGRELDNLKSQIDRIDPTYFSRQSPRYKDQWENLEGYEKKLGVDEQRRLEKLAEEYSELNDNTFFKRWGYVPSRWNIVGMVTSAFLHGGFFHLLFNMLFLWIFGTALEDKMGPVYYTLFYLGGAVAASLTFGLTSLGSDIPMVGASGAISAACGAFMLRFHKTKVEMGVLIWIFVPRIIGRFKISAWMLLLFFLLKDAIFLVIDSGGGVAYGAHVGGGIFGVAVGLAMSNLGWEEKYMKKYDLDGEEHVVPEEYLKACEMASRGDLDGALRNFQATLAKEPGYLPALAEMFKIHAKKQNQQAAANVCTKVVDGFMKLDDEQQAVDNYFKLLKDFPDASLLPAIQFRLADLLTKRCEWRNAAIAYRNLATKHPGGAMAQKALLVCGNLLTDKVGEHQNAMNVFRYLAKTYPQSEFIPYAKQGYERARQALKREQDSQLFG